jgi:ABC-type phosphate/phosphonate transport system permease subunit
MAILVLVAVMFIDTISAKLRRLLIGLESN